MRSNSLAGLPRLHALDPLELQEVSVAIARRVLRGQHEYVGPSCARCGVEHSDEWARRPCPGRGSSSELALVLEALPTRVRTACFGLVPRALASIHPERVRCARCRAYLRRAPQYRNLLASLSRSPADSGPG